MRELTTSEVAELLGIVDRTVLDHMARGNLESCRRIGRNRMFAADEVERFSKVRRPPGRPPKPKD